MYLPLKAVAAPISLLPAMHTAICSSTETTNSELLRGMHTSHTINVYVDTRYHGNTGIHTPLGTTAAVETNSGLGPQKDMKWRSAEWSKFQTHQLVTINFTTLSSRPVSLSSAYPFALLLLHNTKGWADTRDHLLTTSMSLATAQLTSWVPLSQRTALSTHTRVPNRSQVSGREGEYDTSCDSYSN